MRSEVKVKRLQSWRNIEIARRTLSCRPSGRTFYCYNARVVRLHIADALTRFGIDATINVNPVVSTSTFVMRAL